MSTRRVVRCDYCEIALSTSFANEYGELDRTRQALRREGWKRYGNQNWPRLRLDVCPDCVPRAEVNVPPLFEVDR